MKEKSGNYHAFLLRLWREDVHSSWRAALENPHTGEKHTFATPDLLWAYIETQINQSKIIASRSNENKDA